MHVALIESTIHGPEPLKKKQRDEHLRETLRRSSDILIRDRIVSIVEYPIEVSRDKTLLITKIFYQ